MTAPVVSVGTWTESRSGSGGSCCPAPDDDVKSGTDIDMRSIYNILYARISNLEKSVKEQFALISDLTRRGLRVDAGVQADIEKRDRLRATYTEVVKSTPSMQNVDRSATGQSVGSQTIFVDSASLAFLAYKCYKGTAPEYLQELIPRYVPARPLCSSSQTRLRIPGAAEKKIF